MKRRILFVLVPALFLVGAGVMYWQRERLPRRFATVKEGVLYRSAQPEPGHLERLKLDFGIKTLLIVRDNHGERVQGEIAAAGPLGLSVVSIPIDSQTEVTDEQARRFLDCIDNPSNHPVLIHCSAGRHRTGYLCALYRIERQGWPVAKAVDEMLSFGFDVEDHRMLLEQIRRHPKSANSAIPVEPSTAHGAAVRP